MSTLKKLFNQVIDIGYNVQKNQVKDGRAVWQQIEKNVVDILLDNKYKYNENEIFYEDIDKLGISQDNEFNPVVNHFLLQLKNLVLNKSKNLYVESHRLFQIAYNLGQLKYKYEHNDITQHMKNVIDKNMNIFMLEKYVCVDVIDQLDKSQVFNTVLFDNIILDEQKEGSHNNLNL